MTTSTDEKEGKQNKTERAWKIHFVLWFVLNSSFYHSICLIRCVFQQMKRK